MNKKNITNIENNNINIEDENLIQKVDEYNINQLLMNIFKRLLIKSEIAQDSNNDNNSLLKMLVEKIKSNVNRNKSSKQFNVFFK